MVKKYDIIVIGAGSGGLNIAGFMNRVGFSVLLIDKTDNSIGGDCLNFGCVPSKALIHVSRLAHKAKAANKFGLKSTGQIDIRKVTKYIFDKKEVIREHENAEHFRKRGMDVALGLAKFVDKNTIDVKGKHYTAKKIVIATGSRPRKIEVHGIEKVNYLTNEQIFDIKILPKNLLVVGGGPIGIELGQAFQRLGSKVTVIHRSGSILNKEDPEIADVLYQQLIKEGMIIHLNSSLIEFVSKNKVVILDENNKKKTLTFDLVLGTIGRKLNIENLGLEKAGIKVENGKIVLDKYLRTTNKKVLCCGDVAGSYQFTHAAELHASVIINNFFSPFKKKLSNDHLSWVTYTSPEIATFGLNRKQLEERKIKHETLRLNFNHDDRAIVDEATNGKMLVYLSKGKIVGGSVVAPNAGETFQELVLANTVGLKAKSLFSKIYPYPTASRVNKQIIANYYAKKLTPFVKKVFHMLY